MIKRNVHAASRFYNDWTIRIYHDDTIDESIICEIECMKNSQTNEFYNNVDFCNVKQIPKSPLDMLDLSYLLPMTWRWLPIGDQFVDLFMSRDTDSCIFEREVAAVKEWLNSTTLFHIMKGSFFLKILLI